MTVRDENCTVTLRQDGKLDLNSIWSSNVPDGEFARFEILLPEEGPFRFVVDGERKTVVSISRRKVRNMTDASTMSAYYNANPGPNPRLARFTFRAIWKRADGTEVDRKVERKKFLP